MGKVNVNDLINEMEKEFVQELSSLEEEETAGAGAVGNLISLLGGNKGHFCTLTVECMPSCN